MEKLKAGSIVWVRFYDEDTEEKADVTGYLFVAEVENFIIATPRIWNVNSFAAVLEHQVRQSKDWDESALVIFHKEDCFATKEEAMEE